ncbi:MAG: response regulator [Treponema sp.]|jgi:putative two-component system response regulator|nr:response regulator [Treponema sp.]
MAAERKKVLLIDDDEIQLSIAKLALQGEYDIHTAKSGREAIDYLLLGNVPDLILLDILMPKMDGWATFNRIRAISLLKEVPIIFLTSVTDKVEEKRGLEMGAVDYIRKPYNTSDLLERIRERI